MLAALNGVLGDHLETTRNPLAIPMQFRRAGLTLDPAKERGRRILLLVHGLCRSDLGWLHKGHDHGAVLAAELGLTPVYLHYNSGRPIATNGRELAMRLESLVADWGEEVSEIVVVAHSMGGLVMRSACHVADTERLAWREPAAQDRLPRHPAPRRAARARRQLGDARPRPVLLYGGIRAPGADPQRRHYRPALRPGAAAAGGGSFRAREKARRRSCRCRAASPAMRSRRRSRKAPNRHPFPGCIATAKSVLGDGLVPLASALGDDADPARALAIPADRRFVAYGTSHLDLLSQCEIWEQIRSWLAGPDAARPGSGIKA